jgi:hypothetical protein
LKVLSFNHSNFFKKSNSLKSKKIFFYKNVVWVNYKDNFTNFDTYQYTLYNTFVFNNFFKKKRLFLHKVSNNNSVRFKKYTKKLITNKLIQVLINGGNKLKVLKCVNSIHNSFYFLNNNPEKEFVSKYQSFDFFKNFSNTNFKFFNFNFILSVILELNQTIFDLKVVKLNKKDKKKKKQKYNLEVKYLSKNKRFTSVLRNLNLNSNSYNYYKYSERLLASIFDSFFLQKSSALYKKKIYIYNSILKKRSSNN